MSLGCHQVIARQLDELVVFVVFKWLVKVQIDMGTTIMSSMWHICVCQAVITEQCLAPASGWLAEETKLWSNSRQNEMILKQKIEVRLWFYT